MRTLPSALDSALQSGVTTLARCWQIARRDGQVLGFTDHDRTLVFDSIAHEPDSGFQRTSLEAATGLAADTHDVVGALRSDRITAVDIDLGHYDGAEVSLWLVDWTDVSSRVLLSRGQIGAIRRGDIAFEAEVTGLADRLNQPFGRAYVHSCDCRLGDSKCGVDVAGPLYRALSDVASVEDARTTVVNGLGGFVPGWFAGGVVRWTTGANTGVESHVKAHAPGAAGTAIELWLAPPHPIEASDTFEITAGCDRTAATCADRFSNILNFRGFPHMPGDDAAASYPGTGGGHDGGSLMRA